MSCCLSRVVVGTIVTNNSIMDASDNGISLINDSIAPEFKLKTLVSDDGSILLSSINNNTEINVTSNVPLLLAGTNINITNNSINLNDIITLAQVNANLLYDRLGKTSGTYYRPVIHIPVIPRNPPVSGIYYDFSVYDIGKLKIELRGTLNVPASPPNTSFDIVLSFTNVALPPIQISSGNISIVSPLLISFEIDIIPNIISNTLEIYTNFSSSEYVNSLETSVPFTFFTGDVSFGINNFYPSSGSSVNLIRYITCKVLPV